MNRYDVIVIGTGGVGSAALYHLARRGARVIGLDRFTPGHNHGSSHGETRIIRLAYYEHPDYVPLLLRSYDLWQELEQLANQKLYYQTGILAAGVLDGELISGILQSAAQFQLPVETLSAFDARTRWPGFHLPDDFRGVYEQRAGYLKVEECVKAHAEAAVRAGAALRCGSAVRSWTSDGRSVTVQTDEATYRADRLVITAGAWVRDLLPSLGIPFQVLRKVLLWYRTSDPVYLAAAGCPCFMFETPGGTFYGFPQLNEAGVKVAEHTGGTTVDDPLHVDRTLHSSDQQRVENFLADHLPGVSFECSAHATCLYTMSPDGHFIIDHHPEYPQVTCIAGLSGHGFKFTPVLGEIMSDLALDGHSRHPIAFLSHRRFSIRS